MGGGGWKEHGGQGPGTRHCQIREGGAKDAQCYLLPGEELASRPLHPVQDTGHLDRAP